MPAPAAPTPKAPPPAMRAQVANQQANVLGQAAQHAMDQQEENFAFSVVRKTALNLLTPLVYGSVGVSFFGMLVGGMAKSGVAGLQSLAVTILKATQLSGLIQHGASETIADAAQAKAAEITSLAAAADPLITIGLSFGAIALGAALLGNIITTQMECEQARRAKCAQQAQQPQKAPTQQIVIVPVQDIEFNQNSRNDPTDIEIRDHAHLHSQENRLDLGKFTKLINKQHREAELANTTRVT